MFGKHASGLKKTIWYVLRTLTDLDPRFPAKSSSKHAYYGTAPFVQKTVAVAIIKFVDANEHWRPYPRVLIDERMRWHEDIASFAISLKLSDQESIFYERIVKALFFQDLTINDSVTRAIESDDAEFWLARWLEEAHRDFFSPEAKSKVPKNKGIDKLRENEEDEELLQKALENQLVGEGP